MLTQSCECNHMHCLMNEDWCESNIEDLHIDQYDLNRTFKWDIFQTNKINLQVVRFESNAVDEFKIHETYS